MRRTTNDDLYDPECWARLLWEEEVGTARARQGQIRARPRARRTRTLIYPAVRAADGPVLTPARRKPPGDFSQWTQDNPVPGRSARQLFRRGAQRDDFAELPRVSVFIISEK